MDSLSLFTICPKNRDLFYILNVYKLLFGHVLQPLFRAVDTLDILVTAPATCRTTGPDTLPTDIWIDTDTASTTPDMATSTPPPPDTARLPDPDMEPDMELVTAVDTELELDTAPDMEPVTLLDMDPDTELVTVLEPDMEDTVCLLQATELLSTDMFWFKYNF